MELFEAAYPRSELSRHTEEACQTASSRAQVPIGAAPLPRANVWNHTEQTEISEQTVDWLIRARRQRGRYLSGALFSEPAWDMLLDLLKAEIVGRSVSVTSVCLASGVPPTTALRHVGILVERRLVVREADPRDARRTYVRLSPEVSKALRAYFADVVDARPHRAHVDEPTREADQNQIAAFGS